MRAVGLSKKQDVMFKRLKSQMRSALSGPANAAEQANDGQQLSGSFGGGNKQASSSVVAGLQGRSRFRGFQSNANKNNIQDDDCASTGSTFEIGEEDFSLPLFDPCVNEYASTAGDHGILSEDEVVEFDTTSDVGASSISMMDALDDGSSKIAKNTKKDLVRPACGDLTRFGQTNLEGDVGESASSRGRSPESESVKTSTTTRDGTAKTTSSRDVDTAKTTAPNEEDHDVDRDSAVFAWNCRRRISPPHCFVGVGIVDFHPLEGPTVDWFYAGDPKSDDLEEARASAALNFSKDVPGEGSSGRGGESDSSRSGAALSMLASTRPSVPGFPNLDTDHARFGNLTRTSSSSSAHQRGSLDVVSRATPDNKANKSKTETPAFKPPSRTGVGIDRKNLEVMSSTADDGVVGRGTRPSSATLSSSSQSQLNFKDDVQPLLAFLSLPDAAHNVQEDSFSTTYFLFPHASGGLIYGLALYAWQPSREIRRGVKQTSIVVLSRAPFYGHIRKRILPIARICLFGAGGTDEEQQKARVEILTEWFQYIKQGVTPDSALLLPAAPGPGGPQPQQLVESVKVDGLLKKTLSSSSRSCTRDGTAAAVARIDEEVLGIDEEQGEEAKMKAGGKEAKNAAGEESLKIASGSDEAVVADIRVTTPVDEGSDVGVSSSSTISDPPPSAGPGTTAAPTAPAFISRLEHTVSTTSTASASSLSPFYQKKFLLPSLSETELYDSLSDATLFLVRALKKGALFSVLKAIMLEGKVCVYSPSSEVASVSVLALLSLIPGVAWTGFFSHGFGSRLYHYNQYAFPLPIFHERCCVYPYLSLQLLDSLLQMRGFLVGTTNKLLLYNSEPAEGSSTLAASSVYIPKKDDFVQFVDGAATAMADLADQVKEGWTSTFFAAEQGTTNSPAGTTDANSPGTTGDDANSKTSASDNEVASSKVHKDFQNFEEDGDVVVPTSSPSRSRTVPPSSSETKGESGVSESFSSKVAPVIAGGINTVQPTTGIIPVTHPQPQPQPQHVCPDLCVVLPKDFAKTGEAELIWKNFDLQQVCAPTAADVRFQAELVKKLKQINAGDLQSAEERVYGVRTGTAATGARKKKSLSTKNKVLKERAGEMLTNLKERAPSSSQVKEAVKRRREKLSQSAKGRNNFEREGPMSSSSRSRDDSTSPTIAFPEGEIAVPVLVSEHGLSTQAPGANTQVQEFTMDENDSKHMTRDTSGVAYDITEEGQLESQNSAFDKILEDPLASIVEAFSPSNFVAAITGTAPNEVLVLVRIFFLFSCSSELRMLVPAEKRCSTGGLPHPSSSIVR